MDVVARWPGSVYDSTVFDNSQVRETLLTSLLDGYLFSDGGYGRKRNVLTPVANGTTDAQKLYNATNVLAKNCVEQANGMLQRRFPALKYGL